MARKGQHFPQKRPSGDGCRRPPKRTPNSGPSHKEYVDTLHIYDRLRPTDMSKDAWRQMSRLEPVGGRGPNSYLRPWSHLPPREGRAKQDDEEEAVIQREMEAVKGVVVTHAGVDVYQCCRFRVEVVVPGSVWPHLEPWCDQISHRIGAGCTMTCCSPEQRSQWGVIIGAATYHDVSMAFRLLQLCVALLRHTDASGAPLQPNAEYRPVSSPSYLRHRDLDGVGSLRGRPMNDTGRPIHSPPRMYLPRRAVDCVRRYWFKAQVPEGSRYIDWADPPSKGTFSDVYWDSLRVLFEGGPNRARARLVVSRGSGEVVCTGLDVARTLINEVEMVKTLMGAAVSVRSYTKAIQSQDLAKPERLVPSDTGTSSKRDNPQPTPLPPPLPLAPLTAPPPPPPFPLVYHAPRLATPETYHPNFCVYLLVDPAVEEVLTASLIETHENRSDYSSIDVSHNRLTRVDCNRSFMRVRRLDLSHNHLAEVSLNQPLFLSLTSLDLSGNRLRRVTGLQQCVMLERLVLKGNQIQALHDILPVAPSHQLQMSPPKPGGKGPSPSGAAPPSPYSVGALSLAGPTASSAYSHGYQTSASGNVGVQSCGTPSDGLYTLLPALRSLDLTSNPLGQGHEVVMLRAVPSLTFLALSSTLSEPGLGSLAAALLPDVRVYMDGRPVSSEGVTDLPPTSTRPPQDAPAMGSRASYPAKPTPSYQQHVGGASRGSAPSPYTRLSVDMGVGVSAGQGRQSSSQLQMPQSSDTHSSQVSARPMYSAQSPYVISRRDPPSHTSHMDREWVPKTETTLPASPRSFPRPLSAVSAYSAVHSYSHSSLPSSEAEEGAKAKGVGKPELRRPSRPAPTRPSAYARLDSAATHTQHGERESASTGETQQRTKGLYSTPVVESAAVTEAPARILVSHTEVSRSVPKASESDAGVYGTGKGTRPVQSTESVSSDIASRSTSARPRHSHLSVSSSARDEDAREGATGRHPVNSGQSRLRAVPASPPESPIGIAMGHLDTLEEGTVLADTLTPEVACPPPDPDTTPLPPRAGVGKPRGKEKGGSRGVGREDRVYGQGTQSERDRDHTAGTGLRRSDLGYSASSDRGSYSTSRQGKERESESRGGRSTEARGRPPTRSSASSKNTTKPVHSEPVVSRRVRVGGSDPRRGVSHAPQAWRDRRDSATSSLSHPPAMSALSAPPMPSASSLYPPSLLLRASAFGEEEASVAETGRHVAAPRRSRPTSPDRRPSYSRERETLVGSGSQSRGHMASQLLDSVLLQKEREEGREQRRRSLEKRERERAKGRARRPSAPSPAPAMGQGLVPSKGDPLHTVPTIPMVPASYGSLPSTHCSDSIYSPIYSSSFRSLAKCKGENTPQMAPPSSGVVGCVSKVSREGDQDDGLTIPPLPSEYQTASALAKARETMREREREKARARLDGGSREQRRASLSLRVSHTPIRISPVKESRRE
ncbi:hypothetical protein KIPB_000779 [Kipferlia bialata]|uniref:Uncharacterized protein n=1 Tax=Kipferlia bialata TaxID=797122 RepID=A0A9K3CPR6_9EUKA|nr:hypothetical protein KIPB_000779 [Kipferlia bialata]|eukprot:g779.t1